MSDIGETLNHLADVVAENHKLKAEVGALKERAEQAEIERDALKSKLTEEQMNRVNNYADAKRLIEWIHDENRQPANTAFTEGPERLVAYAVEANEYHLMSPTPSPAPSEGESERDKALEGNFSDVEADGVVFCGKCGRQK